jgi:phytoene dehydrogenase-like protein
MSEYIDCYYAQTRRPHEPRPYLDGITSVETAIVGGGLAGLTIAFELAKRGRSVALLEGRRIAWGASGRNGGFCAPGYAAGFDSAAAKAGEASARELYALSRDAVHYVADNLAAFGMPVDPARMGHISARRVPAIAELEQYRDKMAKFGAELRVLSTPQTRALLKSEAYFESIVEPLTFAMHPLNYALALADAIEFLGATVRSGATWDYSTVSLSVPTARLEPALGLMADVALRPDFPGTELERLRKRALTALLQARAVPGQVASYALAQAVFGSHRYGLPSGGTAASLKSLAVADLRAFHSRSSGPGNAALVGVGDV